MGRYRPVTGLDALGGPIAAIHGSDTLAVVAVTGGGVAALQWLLSVPGASRTVLEATVPYAATALEDLLGAAPEQSVSAATAQAMAAACLGRAQRLCPDPPGALLGVGATAALVSDRPKRGEHRAHVALAWTDGTAAGRPGTGGAVWSVTLDKGRRDRLDEDAVVSTLVVAAMSWLCGTDPVADPSGPGDVIDPSWPTRATSDGPYRPSAPPDSVRR